MNTIKRDQWYVVKGLRTLGPFSAKEMRRLSLIGRVEDCDQVSRDYGDTWEVVTQVPELVPAELLDMTGLPGWLRANEIIR